MAEGCERCGHLNASALLLGTMLQRIEDRKPEGVGILTQRNAAMWADLASIRLLILDRLVLTLSDEEVEAMLAVVQP